MYTGNNTKAIRSMDVLSDSLFYLMTQYPFSEITITMICQNAKISRQTFYKLFTTKLEATRYLISTDYKFFEKGFVNQKPFYLKDFIKYTLFFFWKRHELINLLIKQNLEDVFLEELHEKLQDVLSLFKDATILNNPAIYNFFIGGLSALILYQIGYDKVENIDKVATELSDMLGNPVLF